MEYEHKALSCAKLTGILLRDGSVPRRQAIDYSR